MNDIRRLVFGTEENVLRPFHEPSVIFNDLAEDLEVNGKGEGQHA